jgi:hypothetical protein
VDERLLDLSSTFSTVKCQQVMAGQEMSNVRCENIEILSVTAGPIKL